MLTSQVVLVQKQVNAANYRFLTSEGQLIHAATTPAEVALSLFPHRLEGLQFPTLDEPGAATWALRIFIVIMVHEHENDLWLWLQAGVEDGDVIDAMVSPTTMFNQKHFFELSQ